MINLRLALLHSRWMALELWRQPAYIVSTIAFPALFYLIFAVPESKSIAAANFLLASFSGFAFLGVVFLQFGVGLAQERSRSWYQFLKTLPVNWSTLLLARLITSLLFAALAAGVIFVLAGLLTPMHLELPRWLEFLFYLFMGGLAFCCMGLALGYWSTEKTSLPIGNLLYLPLSFAGGLWKPPELLPTSVQSMSQYLPTRLYGNLLWASVKGEPPEWRDACGLLGYLLFSLLLAYWGYRRDNERSLRQ